MHPILGDARKLGLYLLAWIPLCVLVTSFLAPTHLSWPEGLTLAIPLCLIYAFLCLAAWQVCRALPIREGNLIRLITTQLLNAIVGGALWALMARALTSLIGISSDRTAGVYRLIFATGVMLYLLSVAIHYVLIAVEASQAAVRREDQARVEAGKAELRALRAQINPHFLYNSLNSISALTAVDASKAREMCIQLSDFLRQTLGLSEQTNIPLHQELDLVRNYLAIEKVRFGTRFKLEEHIPEQCLEDTVPPLILQPLVENAIVHGIAGVIDAGLLVLEADHTEENKLRLVVENSFDPESRPMREAGFGIPGIRKRLYVIYGKEASLKIVTGENRFRVEVLLPRS